MSWCADWRVVRGQVYGNGGVRIGRAAMLRINQQTGDDMKPIVAACAALLLTSCATQAPRQSQIKPVPADRALAYQSASDGDATIIVTRDVGFAGGGCFAGVYLDGSLVAKIDTGERASLYVPSGRHIIGTWNVGKALCGYREGKDRRETDATLKPGETRKFRILIGNAGVEITPTTL